MIRRTVPLLLFLLLAAALALGLLRHDPDAPLSSALLDQAAPGFELPRNDGPQETFGPTNLRGTVWILNVWASWCAPCREEHAVLMAWSESHAAPLVGLDYKDPDGTAWLAAQGNPYQVSVQDRQGRVGLDYGIAGVPESFVIDKAGRIRRKLVGPLNRALVERELRPLIEKLQHE
ncbi:MAG: DsbE family thiol:disulfide interchange protein [Burkholderiaceae bacterium]|nr:DsbE family thiol:disulfide interchange protein [Roseateles sp.]MBV8470761.1 DsbE family thiol:disulfide interchange protein [Burkholderiaceae bacterium]